MDSHHFFIATIIFLAAATLFVPLAKKLGLGGVVGYLIAGVVIGPQALRLIESPEVVLQFAEIGVVLLLFLVGLELNPRRLWELRVSIFGLGTLQVTLNTLVLSALSWVLLQDFKISLLIGMAFSLSSTALGLQVLKEKHLDHTSGGKSAFSVLLFQDLSVIPMLAVVAWMTADSTPATAAGPLWLTALKGLGAILAVVVGGRYLVRPIFRMIATTEIRELFTAFSLLLVLSAALLMHTVGLSMALGTFLAGVLLADSEYRHELEIDLEPFKGLLLGLFFVGVGMSIELHVLREQGLGVLLAVVTVVLLKVLIQYGLGRVFRLIAPDRWILGIALSQIGEFAFVLLSLGKNASLLTSTQASFGTLVVALSMVTTPLLFVVFERWIMPRFATGKTKRDFDAIEANQGHVILIGFGRFGQVVGRVLHSQKIPTTILENDPEQVELLRKFGWKTFYGDGSRMDLLHAAGIEKSNLVILAIDDMEKSVETAQLIREHFPKLPIIARASTRPDAWNFIHLNIPVVRELLEGGIEAGEHALRALGYPPFEAKMAIHRFRKQDKEMLLESARYNGDTKKLVSLASVQRETLSRLIEEEEKRLAIHDGHGWD